MNTPLVRPADDSDPYGDPAVTGRALDRFVAEQVMDHLQPFTQRPVGCPDNRPGCCVMHYDVFDATGLRLPHYSTDLAAAWLVVVKWCSKGDGFQLDSLGFDGEEWRCGFMDASNGGMEIHWGEADTPALAICRAAITAVSAPPPSRADD